MLFIVMRKEGKKNGGKVKHEENSKTLVTLANKLAHQFFGARSLLLVHVRFKPSQGLKWSKNAFFRKWTTELLLLSVTMEI
jgi:hypothetical protein